MSDAIISLAGNDVVGAELVDDGALMMRQDRRVVAVILCHEQQHATDAWGHRTKTEGPLLLRPKFLLAQTTDQRLADVEAERPRISHEMSGLREAARVAGEAQRKAERELAEERTKSADQARVLDARLRELDTLRKALGEQSVKTRRMEADFGRLRAELGEKEVRRILGYGDEK